MREYSSKVKWMVTFLVPLSLSCSFIKENSIEITPLKNFSISAETGEKPQSKVWLHDTKWRVVLPDESGASIWLLQDSVWLKSLHLSDSADVKADVLPVGDIVHILLFNGENSQLVSLKYDYNSKKYRRWAVRSEIVNIKLEEESETATIAIDGKNRMWVASDGNSMINVRWSDPPYNTWSNPIAIVKGVTRDDICAVTTFPNGDIGLFWSNQKTERFGFKTHQKMDNPDKWSDDEVPASKYALNIHKGMADDHMNFAVASDGTLYVAVKTSYDTKGYPLVSLLVRNPSGSWDKLYNVDDEGSRAIVLLSEKHQRLVIVYSSYRDHQLIYRMSNMKNIEFGKRHVLINGETQKNSINNATGPKHIFEDEVVIIASEDSVAKSVKINCRR